MGTTYGEKIVISVGGSLIVPKGGIDTQFLLNLNSFIREQLAKNNNRQFFLVIGGGGTARQYRDAGGIITSSITDEDLDWLGIHATRLNAHLVRTMFHDIAHPMIIEHYDIIRKVTEPVVVASGWKPGFSTDFDAVMLCDDYEVRTIINLSDIDNIFDDDPKTNLNAKAISKINWYDFRKLVGDLWKPGMNAPFDPIAAKKAQELNVKVVVLNGNNFPNLSDFLDGKEFTGTTIE